MSKEYLVFRKFWLGQYDGMDHLSIKDLVVCSVKLPTGRFLCEFDWRFPLEESFQTVARKVSGICPFEEGDLIKTLDESIVKLQYGKTPREEVIRICESLSKEELFPISLPIKFLERIGEEDLSLFEKSLRMQKRR